MSLNSRGRVEKNPVTCDWSPDRVYLFFTMKITIPIMLNTVATVPITPKSALLSIGTHCVKMAFRISQNAFQISNKVVSPMMEEIHAFLNLLSLGFVFGLGFRGADGIIFVLSDVFHFLTRKKKP